MDQAEVRRRAVLVEQSAFRACMACTGGQVGHSNDDGIVCARDPQVPDCGLLSVNKLRGAPPGTEALLAEMTEEWAMSHAGGNVRLPAA